MAVERFWLLLVQDVVGAYYAHPYAWDEIGFGGPAYPRGYMRLENGEPEPWEVDERRYEWDRSRRFTFRKVYSSREARKSTKAVPAKEARIENAALWCASSAPRDMHHRLGAMQRLEFPMRRYRNNEEVDYCIVGVGSAGGVLLQRLARAGFSVVGLEAGPFWDTERDWVSDEAGSHNLYWNDLRITGGEDPLALGANNSGRGVGGGSVHWAGFTPRFHPSDFRVHTEDGVGVGLANLLRRSQAVLRTARKGNSGFRPALLSLGRSARLYLRSASHGRVRRHSDQRLHETRHPRKHRRPGGHSGGLARRPSALHLSRLLHSGMQGRRQAEHADHSRSRCDRARRGNSRRTAWPRASTGEDGRVTGVTYFDPRRKRGCAEGQSRDRLRVCHRNAAAAAELRLSRPREWSGEFQRHGRPLPDGARRATWCSGGSRSWSACTRRRPPTR